MTTQTTPRTSQLSDFELSPTLKEFQARAREFAQTEVKPKAGELDRERRFPRELVDKAREKGFLKVTIPEKHGGTNLGNLASCIMLEEINAACPSTGVTISVHNSLFCSLLAKWGNEEQQAYYFGKTLKDNWIGAYCLSEAGAGSDVAALRCEAKKEGDDFILNGPKLWITTGSEADVFVVFARTGPDRTRGISAFLVEAGWDGVGVGKKERKLGIKASPTVEIVLENVRVPADKLLGPEGKGMSIALDTLDGGRLGIASQSLGITRASLEVIRDHLGQFKDAKGRPTASQASLWKMADIASDLDAYRMLTWRAAILRDRGEHCAKESAMAKLCTSRLSNRAARDAVSILGELGANGTNAAERLMRDARITEIYEGVTDIQRLVVARGVLADDQ